MECKKKRLKFRILFMILMLPTFYSGCFLFDTTNPEIFFTDDDVIRLTDNQYEKICKNTTSNDTLIKIAGNVKDDKGIKSIQEDDIILELKEGGEFSASVFFGTVQSRFVVEDTSGNSTAVTMKFVKDTDAPVIKNIRVNGINYTDNMVIGKTNYRAEIALTVEDKKVKYFKINNTYVTGSNGNYVYQITDLKNGINSISMSAEDYGGNTTDKIIKILYDENPPEIAKIKVDGVDVLEPFTVGIKTGKNMVTLSGEINDESGNIKVIKINGGIINTIDKNKFSFETNILNTGINNFEFYVSDIFDNVLIRKVLPVEYIQEIPEVKNISVSKSGVNLYKDGEIYYTNGEAVDIKGDVFSGKTNLKIKRVAVNSINATIIQNTSFLKNVPLTANQVNNEVIIAENEAGNLSLPITLKIKNDMISPVIAIRDNILGNPVKSLYIKTTASSIKLKDYMTIQISDENKIKNQKYRVDYGDYSIFTIDTLTISAKSTMIPVEFIAEDIAGNITEPQLLKVYIDNAMPELTSLKVNDEEKIADIISSGKIVTTMSTINIKASGKDNVLLDSIKIDGFDCMTTAVAVKISDTKGTVRKKIIIADKAGNERNIEFDIIKDTIPIVSNVECLTGDTPLLYNNGTYYTNKPDVTISGVTNDKIAKIEVSGVENLNYSIIDNGFYINLHTLPKGESNVDITIYNANNIPSLKKSIKVYYETILPIIKNVYIITTDLSDSTKTIRTPYSQSLYIPMRNYQIEFEVSENTGVKTVTLLNDSKTGAYTSKEKFIFDITAPTSDKNTVTITATDMAGNKSEMQLLLLGYTLEKPELIVSEKDITVSGGRVIWNNYGASYAQKYELYISENSEDISSKIYEGTIENSFQLSNLKDNFSYYLKLVLWDKYGNKQESAPVSIRTKNKTPATPYITKTLSLQNGIEIDWKRVAAIDEHDFKAYLIYRNDSNTELANYKVIKMISDINTLSMVDSMDSLPDNNLYRYYIEIIDKGGAVSAKSDIASEYSYNKTPVIPSDFALQISDGSLYMAIDLLKSYGTKYGTGKVKEKIRFKEISNIIKDLKVYELFRTSADGMSPAILIARVNKDGISIDDYGGNAGTIDGDVTNGYIEVEDNNALIGLSEGRKYGYKLRIVDENYNNGLSQSFDKSEYSDTKTEFLNTTDFNPPQIKTLKMTKLEKSVLLSWKLDFIDDFSKYEVYREGVLIKTITDISEMYMEDLQVPTTGIVRYKIAVVDKGGRVSQVLFNCNLDTGILTLE